MLSVIFNVSSEIWKIALPTLAVLFMRLHPSTVKVTFSSTIIAPPIGSLDLNAVAFTKVKPFNVMFLGRIT